MANPDPTAARVLIVDDEPANTLLLERVLQRDGFGNIEATNDAACFLSIFAAWRPDIVLLDLHMPVLNGFAVMRQLRRHTNGGTAVPVLVLTADTTPETHGAALTAGASGVLTKPIDPAQVVDRVRSLLAQPRLRT